jgi:catechol 2,3-dioxygenase-like lactoylglutathione lyase family enzyme
LIAGGFLEISVHTPAIQDSLAFYESLGFVQATAGETWLYPYAVVTDGRLFLGLHGAPVAPCALSFVTPHVLGVVEQLEAQGVHFDELNLTDQAFNRAAFRDPSGLLVNLLEARTYSPPQLERPVLTTCGYFSELGAPVRELEATLRFWEQLGFVALEEEAAPFARTPLTSSRLNLALYRARAFRAPVLTFEDDNMRERIALLRERSYALTDEMPDSLDESSNAVLIAPEGTRILLMQAAD